MFWGTRRMVFPGEASLGCFPSCCSQILSITSAFTAPAPLLLLLLLPWPGNPSAFRVWGWEEEEETAAEKTPEEAISGCEQEHPECPGPGARPAVPAAVPSPSSDEGGFQSVFYGGY